MDPTLRSLLQGTSRSFYLSLRLLPPATAPQIGLAYLIARATDTIADTEAVAPALRAALLRALAAELGRERALGAPQDEQPGAVLDRLLGGTPAAAFAATRAMSPAAPSAAELALLRRLPALLATYQALAPADRRRTGRCLRTIISGQLLDLERFAGARAEAPVALPDRAALEDYCWRVAGVVGAYWTEMHCAHLPALRGTGPRGQGAAEPARLRRLGIRYGKALQLLNVLRDLPRDLARGRCYLPADGLAALGLAPRELRAPELAPRLRPLYDELLQQTLAGLAAGARYLLLLPPGQLRLRLATALPLWIGLETLRRLRASPAILDPRRVIKVPRRQLYRLLAAGALRLPSGRASAAFCRRLLRRAALPAPAPGLRPVAPAGEAGASRA
ncbi:MAG: farnesyl-diphosphate farnesyltransferase [Planctomycetota bacterium]|nr:MAG: farnesyl-diphosphate farnesyltransferase [Planctomycetota bacterium]